MESGKLYTGPGTPLSSAFHRFWFIPKGLPEPGYFFGALLVTSAAYSYGPGRSGAVSENISFLDGDLNTCDPSLP